MCMKYTRFHYHKYNRLVWLPLYGSAHVHQETAKMILKLAMAASFIQTFSTLPRVNMLTFPLILE